MYVQKIMDGSNDKVRVRSVGYEDYMKKVRYRLIPFLW